MIFRNVSHDCINLLGQKRTENKREQNSTRRIRTVEERKSVESLMSIIVGWKIGKNFAVPYYCTSVSSVMNEPSSE